MANQSTRTNHATSVLPQVDSQDDDPDITTSSSKHQTTHLRLPRPFSTYTHLLAGLLFLCVTATQTLAFPAAEDPARATHVFDVVASPAGTCACAPPAPEGRQNSVLFAVEAAMIPVLVILSGIFAGLTLGYMSLDTTQLNVLAKSGSPKQQKMAKRVLPIRKDGHVLLITLLLANMIVNETLPVIADGVLGGGVQAVVISTVLVVIFSEIIPQSVCSRFGLAIGSAMVTPVQILIYAFYIVSWPTARLLTYLLGAHSGVVYRRAELKELINIHSDSGQHGGDLHPDTITIVGATLDLQTKVVSDAMTPMPSVFQLPITSVLDYETLGRVLKAGHSRIPVYEECGTGDQKKNKVIGVLLTKQLILLDPEDAVPLRDIPMNPLPIVPEDLPLLQILNTFQEGRSHIAIVCRRKPGFSFISPKGSKAFGSGSSGKEDQIDSDMEKGESTAEQSLLRSLFYSKKDKEQTGDGGLLATALANDARISRTSLREQYLDEDYPVGVITLEHVLEELIGEEIYDETDNVGTEAPALELYIPAEAIGRLGGAGPPPAPSATVSKLSVIPTTAPAKVTVAGAIAKTAGRIGMGITRSRSAPGKTRTSDPAPPPSGLSESVVGVEPPPKATKVKEPKQPKAAKTKKDASTSTTVAPATVPDPLPPAHDAPEVLDLIRETSWSDSSDADNGQGTKASASDASGSTPLLPPTAPVSILRPTTSDGITPPTTPLSYTRAAPPLLSDAVLLERGRRMLLAQGADPSNLPALRLAAPRSQPPSRSGTPTPGPATIVVPTPGGVGKKGTFKSPALLPALPIPIRQAIVVKGETSKADGEETEEDKEKK